MSDDWSRREFERAGERQKQTLDALSKVIERQGSAEDRDNRYKWLLIFGLAGMLALMLVAQLGMDDLFLGLVDRVVSVWKTDVPTGPDADAPLPLRAPAGGGEPSGGKPPTEGGSTPPVGDGG